MGRLFNNNVANYMSRAFVDLGLNGATECSWAFWIKPNEPPAAVQLIFTKAQRTSPSTDATIATYFDVSLLKPKFLLENAAFTQKPDWRGPALTKDVWTRCLFTFKRNAITSADGVLYYNGIAQTIEVFTSSGYAANFTIGENSNNLHYGVDEVVAEPYSGSLAWMTIWNRQLTAQEALDDYGSPLAVPNGRVSCVELCPDTDLSLGGSMTVNGSLACAGSPVFSSLLPMPQGMA